MLNLMRSWAHMGPFINYSIMGPGATEQLRDAAIPRQANMKPPWEIAPPQRTVVCGPQHHNAIKTSPR